MKRIITIALIAVLALSSLVFAGCSANKQSGLAKQIQGYWLGNYTVIEFTGNNFTIYSIGSDVTITGTFKIEDNDIVLTSVGKTSVGNGENILENVSVNEKTLSGNSNGVTMEFTKISESDFKNMTN